MTVHAINQSTYLTHADLIRELRESIRHCGKRFRVDTDNSPSLFHPELGFTVGYDVAKVEGILDRYEEQTRIRNRITIHDSEEAALCYTAQDVADYTSDTNVRNFAERVEQYMEEHSRDIIVED